MSDWTTKEHFPDVAAARAYTRTLRAQGYKPEGFGVDGEPESRMRRVMTGGNYYSVEVRNEPVAEDPKPKKAKKPKVEPEPVVEEQEPEKADVPG